MLPILTRALGGLALGALLYAAPSPSANAADLSDADRAALSGLRGETLQRLVIHEVPRDPLAPAFLTEDQGRTTLDAFRGKVVLVNFWATWCAPCRKEMPAIDALARDMAGPDFAVVPVSTDFGGLAKPKAFFDQIGVQALSVYLDGDRELAEAAGVSGLPVTLLLDREGREVARLLGDAEWDSAEARAVVERLISATAPAGG